MFRIPYYPVWSQISSSPVYLLLHTTTIHWTCLPRQRNIHILLLENVLMECSTFERISHYRFDARSQPLLELVPFSLPTTPEVCLFTRTRFQDTVLLRIVNAPGPLFGHTDFSSLFPSRTTCYSDPFILPRTYSSRNIWYLSK